MKIRSKEEYRQALEACREYALIQVQDNEGTLRRNWKVDVNDINELLTALNEYKPHMK